MLSEHISQFDVKNWWLHLVSGILLILGGIIIFSQPLSSYVFISILFSVFLFISGIIEIIFAATNRKNLQEWGWNLAIGIIDVLMGLVLIRYPLLSLAIIPFIMGFWLMFRGAALVGFSLLLHSLDIRYWGWFLALGLFLSLFAVYIILNPVLGAITTIGMVAAGFIMTGISNIAFSLKLKKFKGPEMLRPAHKF